MMGWRFKKSIKIFPGVSVNFSSEGASISIGSKGIKLNIGPNNARVTAGIPGTGISYSEQIGNKSRK